MRPFYNLRIRFAECEITQNEVARRAGMAPSTMTARMTGQQPFDAWQMDAIAQADRARTGSHPWEILCRQDGAPDQRGTGHDNKPGQHGKNIRVQQAEPQPAPDALAGGDHPAACLARNRLFRLVRGRQRGGAHGRVPGKPRGVHRGGNIVVNTNKD